jgi:hypothetical protein
MKRMAFDEIMAAVEKEETKQMKYFEDILKNRDFLDPDEVLLMKAASSTGQGSGVVGAGGSNGPAPCVGDIRIDPITNSVVQFDGWRWVSIVSPYSSPSQVPGLPPSVKTFKEVEIKFEIKCEPKENGCPKCGHLGKFVRMALCCPTHGVFGGC